MNEDVDIALLAHQANMGLNQIYQTPQRQRVDPRQFLNNYGVSQGRPNFHPNYIPPPQPYYSQVGGVEEYGLPPSIPAQTSQLPMVMRDRDGNIIDLSQTPSVMSESSPHPNPHQQPNGMNDVRGFQIPDYSKYNKSTPPQYHEDESESTLDIILKEIKSLKKAVNKLIRETEKSKLSPVTNTTQPSSDINAINIKSPVISEGIPVSNFGD